MPRKLILIGVSILFAEAVFSQDYRILHWGIENGLSQGINQKMMRDAEGFLWATSYEGVNRFDGKTFRNFYSFPKKRNSIHGTETTGLVQDSLHKIWIGSGNGLNCYDPVTDSVIAFAPEGSIVKPVDYIIPVAATSKEVICFDMSGKLTAWDCASFTKRVIAANIPWYDDYINVNNSWLDKKNNTLWMPAQSGVLKVDIKTGKTDQYLAAEQVNAIIPDTRPGILLLATNDGIIEWNSVSAAINHIKTLDSSSLGKITCLAKDSHLNTWIGTEEYGLFIISPENAVTRIQKTNQQNSIQGNKVNTIYCDHAGMVWISVGTNGIDQLIPGNRFTHYSENLYSANTLSNNIVRCFIENNDKKVWIATQGGGINIFDPASKSFSSLTKQNMPGLPFDFIRFMVKEGNNAWIGTEKGMCRVNMGSLQTSKIHFTNKEMQPLPDPYIEQIIAYENNSWLIATKEYGLFQLPKESSTAIQLPFPGNEHVFYTAWVNNTLFVSLWDANPKLFRIENGQWKELKKGISSFTITYVLHDKPAKRYWIGTLSGLLETDEDLNIIHHYTREDGLSNHYIYAMAADKNGMLWISTNRGLSLFNPVTHSFRVFTPADGLQGYEYNAKAVFLASDGNLYFGGTNGFDIIRTYLTDWQPEPARFYIRDLLVNNVSWSQKGNANHISSISLPYTGNNITIQAGIVDFASSGNSKIRYKLQGSDADWKIADRDASINYSGLPPGDYTFTATAAGMDNEWNDKATILHFAIAKPWWQSLWFRLSMIAAVTGLITMIIRSYYQRKLEKQKMEFEKKRAVEHERTRIATDMHDDMGAGLSRIKFLSETIGIKKQQQQPIEEDINKIKEYSHDMIDKMGEIVWALNEKNDSLSDLLAYTRAYAVEYLLQNGIQCSIEAPEHFSSAFVSGEFRRNVYLTAKEALHNIVKHAQADKVSIRIETGDHLIISIRDNGKGFDEKTIRPYSNGLTNMKKRMAILGGKLDIKNGEGTIVVLKVPVEGRI